MPKTFKIFAISILFLTGISIVCTSQNLSLIQSNKTGIYQKGETIKITLSAKDMEVDSITVISRKNYSADIKEYKIKIQAKETEVFNESFNESTSMIFVVKTDSFSVSTGLVVAPEEFYPGTERPKDFNKFWKKEKKALRALPVKIVSNPVENIEEGFDCEDIELNCTGPKPARGYFARPKSAKAKSLPIVLIVHAAGVKGSWCLSRPETALNYAKKGKGALAFDLNAHGMLNGQAQEYYDNLEEGELKGYYYQGIENREEFYFRGMYLRLLRTLDFLCNQPEWDGKRIIVIGESQGGGQAFAAAGLDKRVTAAVATVPAMCDWGGPSAGRNAGWPQPFSQAGNQQKMLETLPYFDAAHILKNSKAILLTEIGFIDIVCPSTSIYAAINQAKGEKIIFGVPYRGHHVNQKQFQKIWEETVYKPRIEFIDNFLE